MLKDSQNSPAPVKNKGALAVLFLSFPPAKGNPADWYWRKVAGLPFLLRNILNIQKGGINNLVLFSSHNLLAAQELLNRLVQDPRVTLQLDCLTDAGQVMDAANGARELIFLEGSALYDKANIKSAIEGKQDSPNNGHYRSLSIAFDSLTSLLQPNNIYDFSRLEQARERSDNAPPFDDPESENKSLIYFSEADNPKISIEEDFEIESERIIKKSGGLANDSFATRILSRPVSRLLTRMLLNTDVTPNQITWMSFALGLLSAWSFFQGGYQLGLLGAGFLLLSIWVDGVDGEIARIKFMDSAFGAKLDIYCDNIVHVVVFFSIGMGLYHAEGEMVYVYLGSLAAIGSLISFLMLGSAITQGKSQATLTAKQSQDKNPFIEKLANRDFTHFLFVLALFGRLDVFLWLTAIGVNLLVVYLLFSLRKSGSAEA